MVRLSQVYNLQNLKRAWRWLLTNREAQYKNYFRHVYRAYALAAEDNIRDLRSRLRAGVYTPKHATKVYQPKPSGVFRPITLLTVEDQIVYQAYGNVIAEQLFRRVSHRYFQQVFGHLYAGKRSFTFYRDWRSGYKQFTSSIRSAYMGGLEYTASFDLTACYDSIDHAVLGHFLMEIGLSTEARDSLCSFLTHWTAASHATPIYHGHGIPQGPLTSGLIAECVLQRLDRIRISKRERYLRYVDDIRLFARTEKALRKRLVSLDLASKELGLFPQSGKIRIHRIKNIEEEIKGISNPPELGTPGKPATQKKIHRRLVQLSPRLTVKNDTRFRFVLGKAIPRASQTYRLLRILDVQPHLYQAVCGYLSRADRHPAGVSRACIKLLKSQDLYYAFTAALLRALGRGFHPRYRKQLASQCRKNLKVGDAELNAAAGSTLLTLGEMSWPQTKYRVTQSRNWFVRSWLCGFVDKNLIGDPSYEWLLNQLIRDRVQDVAIVAADLLLAGGLAVRKPTREIHRSAQLILRNGGMIGRVSVQVLLTDLVASVIGSRALTIDWRKILGVHHRPALQKLSRWYGYARTDPTAWINLTDTVNDLILDRLFDHEAGMIGKYRLGDVGSVLGKRSRFARKHPKFFHAVSVVHKLRLESDLSHAFLRSTRRSTRRIEYKELRAVKQVLLDGYLELWNTW